MHLLVRETQGLDDDAAAEDLNQSPADLVVLSFSDSDLGTAAMAWRQWNANGGAPSLRLASLARLRHPMSVDLYLEQVITQARCVVVRLLGGLEYWRYGAEEIATLCQSRAIALALLPGSAQDDPRLRTMSTVAPAEWDRLNTYMHQGGPDNMRHALQLAAYLGGCPGGSLAGSGPEEFRPPQPVPSAGLHPLPQPAPDRFRANVALVFYRSHLLAGDIAPIEALATRLAAHGLAPSGVFVSSLKDPQAARFVRAHLAELRPRVILNATAFATRDASDHDKPRHDTAGREATSPLDEAGVPVLQAILSSATQADWARSTRGLSPGDLAMQAVLPELDGRLLTTAISFKSEQMVDPHLEFSRVAHQPDTNGIALVTARAVGWTRLATTKAAHRRVAIILSDYPGAGGQRGHAVGLDSAASMQALTALLRAHDYTIGDGPIEDPLRAAPRPFMDLASYQAAFATLPEAFQRQVMDEWGDPDKDPAFKASSFHLPFVQTGHLTIAIQPDRGTSADRKTDYHAPDRPPRHAYVAFYLWLRHTQDIHALVHLGTHGTLEWLPGKAAALSETCAPMALLGGLPVIYPFIVNNPGEATSAKRRLGAVTIGHLTPPLRSAGAYGAVAELEKLIDEYAAADGLDRRRARLLRRDILDRAAQTHVLAESGARDDTDEDEQLARLDAYLCDVKDLQIRDGLHIFGQPPGPQRREMLLAALAKACPGIAVETLQDRLDASAAAERAGFLAALDGRFVPPGPAGAPTRGRADVLPTGRNLYTADPRAIPTRSAMVLAHKSAQALLERHVQDHGEWPKAVTIDLWGSTTMRTGGEDLALALVLMGVAPTWDEGSNRVNGFEILPLARMDRPRIDVTLRISGLFRDAFETQMALFDAATRALAARDEAPDWNPLAAQCRGLKDAALRRASARIFGAAPGQYGVALNALDQDRATMGATYLAASAASYGKDLDGVCDPDAFAARVAASDAFIHQQDHAETDLLDSADTAAHEGGFAALAAGLERHPALYHTDTSCPDTPRVRSVAEEIARIVRGRVANPVWLRAMMRHGYRGAAEITRAAEPLHLFAATLPQRLDHQFDLMFDATLGDPEVDAFLCRENPLARLDLAQRLRDARIKGLWRCTRNSVSAVLDQACADASSPQTPSRPPS